MEIEGHVTLEPRDQWERFWRGVSSLGDLGNAEIEKIADAGRRGVSDNFEREQSPDGTPWHPLALMTQRVRRLGIDTRRVPFRVAGAHPILVRTGDLRQSFENPNHPNNVTDIHRSAAFVRVELGAEDDIKTPGRIATLHSGGVTPDGYEVPARPFVGWSDASINRIDDTARWVIGERVKRLP